MGAEGSNSATAQAAPAPPPPPRAISTAANNPWNNAGLPYYHTDILGRRWIYAHATSNGCCLKTAVRGTLWQWGSGAWHLVGQASKIDTKLPVDVLDYVYCGKPYTAYPFVEEAQSWVYGPTGWLYQGYEFSATKTMYC